MKKLVIVINGKGGTGKDTLCNFVSQNYKTMNVSSIDPIKDMAKIIGWDEAKDKKSRKLLSDLKRIATEYNDYPTQYILKKYVEFLDSDYEILFVHIREPEQIHLFCKKIGYKALTLLIRRKMEVEIFGNSSDDDVEKYHYDYIYNNDKPLFQAENDFMNFFRNIYKNNKGIDYESII